MLVDRIDLLVAAEDAVLKISSLALNFAQGTIGGLEALFLLGKFKSYVGQSFTLVIADFAGAINLGF